VRLKVDTLSQVMVIPTSAVQRGPAGTFSYVINDDDTVTATPVVVTQQNETDAVIARGLSTSDRVVTTGFANLSDGARVTVGKDDQMPSADLAPRRRGRRDRGGDRGSRGEQAKGGQAMDGQAKDGQSRDGQNWDNKGGDGQGEHRRWRERHPGEGGAIGEGRPARGADAAGNGAKAQP
jgi:multidrug efflux system membrane fusion protein